MIDYAQTIISQYANSPILLGLLGTIDEAIDPIAQIDEFYTYVWNALAVTNAILEDAVEGPKYTYGLNVWGSIVGISRVVVAPKPVLPVFGFKGSGLQPFNQGVFYSRFHFVSHTLTNTEMLLLILLKARANITGCTAPEVNAVLQDIFPTTRCYVQNPGSMQLYFIFERPITDRERALLLYSGALPQPSGVQISVLDFDPLHTFGFKGSGFQPFNQGVFYHHS